MTIARDEIVIFEGVPALAIDRLLAACASSFYVECPETLRRERFDQEYQLRGDSDSEIEALYRETPFDGVIGTDDGTVELAALVAAEFLRTALQTETKVVESQLTDRLARRTQEHLTLVAISLVAAILIAVPLGIISARVAQLGQVILSVTGAIQTIPSLALLVFMIPIFGINEPPAIAALFLYSLLPIVRNTYTGLIDIPTTMRESAEALGLPSSVRLRKIELPLASRSILAGIKTSAVINVGFATIGAFIGAGGYGQPILTGLRLDDHGLIMEGAIPAAILALMIQWAFEFAERWLVPKGLRLQPVE